MSLLILRIFHGHPFKVEAAAAELGAKPYLPRETIRRRDPRDRSRIFDVRKPLLPGLLFVAKQFPLEALPVTLLAQARARAHVRWVEAHERTKPVTAHCRVSWLGTTECPAKLTDEAEAMLREAERAENGRWRPFVDEIATAVLEIARGARKRNRYVALADYAQGVA